MFRVDQSTVRNRLLAGLPPEAFALLADHLQPAELPFRQILHQAERPIEAVHFPESGMVSQLATLEDGELQEIGLIGREGLVGLPLVLGVDSAPVESIVQMPGAALRIGAAALRRALDGGGPALQAPLLRYAQAFFAQVAQTAACNGHHAVDARLSRWMLMAHDRAEADEFPMTQEFLANMLGVRRPSVSVAATILQKAGLIRYARGRMGILDRGGLEEASCECYGAVRRQFDRLLGFPAGE